MSNRPLAPTPHTEPRTAPDAPDAATAPVLKPGVRPPKAGLSVRSNLRAGGGRDDGWVGVKPIVYVKP